MNTEKLFWEKYRPKTLDEVIIPDRIRKFLENGIQTNMIFTGSAGLGKTTCAKILVEKHYHLFLSSKNKKLGVDVLRNEIDNFCKRMFVSMDDEDIAKDKLVRVIYFEEFDRATNDLQEELKSFIEDNSERVRFIATCNNINEINDPIQSRFSIIDFTPNPEDSNDMKKQYYKRILDIATKENINIPKKEVGDIILKRFPDFRKIWSDVQYFHLSGHSTSTISNGNEELLYELIFNSISTVELWDYLYSNWIDRIPNGFAKLGREFFNWVKENKPEYINKLGDALITLSEYSDVRLPHTMDSFVTFYALVCRYNQIFK